MAIKLKSGLRGGGPGDENIQILTQINISTKTSVYIEMLR